MEIPPAKLIGVVGATVGYAVAEPAVPAKVAEPLVPPNGDPAFPLKVTNEPTTLVRVVPDASVTAVLPDALLKRYHRVGPSVVTDPP